MFDRQLSRRVIPCSIERRDCDCIRHGAVNGLLFPIAHSGQMEVVIEPRKEATLFYPHPLLFFDGSTSLYEAPGLVVGGSGLP